MIAFDAILDSPIKVAYFLLVLIGAQHDMHIVSYHTDSCQTPAQKDTNLSKDIHVVHHDTLLYAFSFST